MHNRHTKSFRYKGTHLYKTEKSEIDSSVNFLFKGDYEGVFEARFVQRSDDYFVCYLSSQSGCNQGCNQCHLTQTKQTKFKNATAEDYLIQARTVINYFKNIVKGDATTVHFSFMSRGEPLDNHYLLKSDNVDCKNVVISGLDDLASLNGLFARFCVSTIFPKSAKDLDITNVFMSPFVDFYYSIYSVDEEWKKKWMPQAMNVEDAILKLKEYQFLTRKVVKIHWPFIKDENDSEENVRGICELIKKHQLRADINIIKYNPYSVSQGVPSDVETVKARVSLIKELMGWQTQVWVAPKVGFDVKASCGMFVDKMNV